MDKIKGQLAGVAALLGVIAAIGGGFVKYGEIVTKLDALESQEHSTVDTSNIESAIAVLEEKVSKLENADTSHTHDLKHTHDNTAICADQSVPPAFSNASNLVVISPYFTKPPPIAAMTPSKAATPAN